MTTFAERVFEEGKVEGKLEGFEETLEAINLIENDWNNQAISEKTGLSLNAIEKLRKKITH